MYEWPMAFAGAASKSESGTNRGRFLPPLEGEAQAAFDRRSYHQDADAKRRLLERRRREPGGVNQNHPTPPGRCGFFPFPPFFFSPTRAPRGWGGRVGAEQAACPYPAWVCVSPVG